MPRKHTPPATLIPLLGRKCKCGIGLFVPHLGGSTREVSDPSKVLFCSFCYIPVDPMGPPEALHQDEPENEGRYMK